MARRPTPVQVSIWDLLGNDPGPATKPERVIPPWLMPPAKPDAAEADPPAPPAEEAAEPAEAPIALQVDGDEILEAFDPQKWCDIMLCRRVVQGVGDGILPGCRYLLVRMHEDAERRVYTRKIRDEDWERHGEDWAISDAMSSEAALWFYIKTRDGTPRKLGRMI